MTRTPLREFALASLLHGLFLLWAFRVPLLKGQVASYGAELPAVRAISSMNEELYQMQAMFYNESLQVKSGTFPSWAPGSEAGTPFIGKMQTAVFSPMALPYYLLPLSWLPWTFMLVVVLKSYCGFWACFLFARALRLRFSSAFFAATVFAFSGTMFGDGLFAMSASSIYVPLALLFVELYFRGYRRLSLFSLPWALALPFLAGHFECSARTGLAAAAYFGLRLAFDPETTGRLRRAMDFIGAAAAGATIAACQIVPGILYQRESYNNAWRSLKEYGWVYHSFYKRLSAEDLPLLLAGLSLAYVFTRLLSVCRRSGKTAQAAGAAAAFAAALACLAHLGMDPSPAGLISREGPLDAASWLTKCFLLFLAYWGASREEAPRSVRALGWILLTAALVQLRTPPLANLVGSLPLLRQFNNVGYYPEFNVCLAILGAYGAESLLSLRLPFKERALAGARACLVFGALAAGVAAAPLLRGPLSRLVSTSPVPSGDSAAGGIMGPEKASVSGGSSWTVSGWLPPLPIPSSAVAGVAKDGKAISAIPVQWSASGSRLYFHADVPLPEEGQVDLFAQAAYEGGAIRTLRGPQIQLRDDPGRSATALAGLAAMPLAFVFEPALQAASVLVLADYSRRYPMTSVPRDELPFRLPGLDKLRADSSLFRIDSLQWTFLQADYANLYGIADIRNGGDNLDVLSLIYFLDFAHGLTGDPKDARAREAGLKLLGLANVKYLLQPPAAGAPPGAFYSGSDMTIMENPFARPRARFFEQAAVLPLPVLRDWSRRGETFSSLGRAVSSLDLDKTLLLNDSPEAGESPAPGRPASGPASVAVEDYGFDRVRISVTAPKEGFLFLADNVFPGWKAWVNGKPARILRSWATFRAVRVPAGKSVVEMRYRPLGLFAAVFLSSCAALAWFCLFLRYRLRREGPGDALEAAGGSKKKRLAETARLKEEQDAALWPARAAETLVCALAGSTILFWLSWSALFCANRAVNATAAALVLALAGFAVLEWRARSRPPLSEAA